MSFKKTSREMGFFIKILKNCKKSGDVRIFSPSPLLRTKIYSIILLTKIIFVTKICAVISKRRSYIISKRVQAAAAHFETTVINYFKRTVFFRTLWDYLLLIYRTSFRRENHILSFRNLQILIYHFEEIVICHFKGYIIYHFKENILFILKRKSSSFRNDSGKAQLPHWHGRKFSVSFLLFTFSML